MLTPSIPSIFYHEGCHQSIRIGHQWKNVSIRLTSHLTVIRFLGTSGQTIDSIRKFMNIENPFDLLEKTLEWAHVSPTSPDQLHSYPFATTDPYIIDRCPHVYFIGNQPKFDTRLIHGNSQLLKKIFSS